MWHCYLTSDLKLPSREVVMLTRRGKPGMVPMASLHGGGTELLPIAREVLMKNVGNFMVAIGLLVAMATYVATH